MFKTMMIIENLNYFFKILMSGMIIMMSIKIIKAYNDYIKS